MLCFPKIASRSYLDTISSISDFSPLRDTDEIWKLSALIAETPVFGLCKFGIFNWISHFLESFPSWLWCEHQLFRDKRSIYSVFIRSYALTCFTSNYCLFCYRSLSSIYSPIRPCFILTLLFRSPSSIIRLVPFNFSYKFCIACYDFCTLKSPISKNKSII